MGEGAKGGQEEVKLWVTYRLGSTSMASETPLDKVFAFGKRVVAAYKLAQQKRRMPLHERYEDIIEGVQRTMIFSPTRIHYVDDVVSECVRKIALQEGRSDVAPHTGEWLSRWRKRTSSTEYLELARYLEDLFQRQYSSLKQEQQRADQQAMERRYEEYEQWFSRHRSLVEKFLEIADRKVSSLDDYGDEKWDALPKEVYMCLLKIARTEPDNGATEATLREAQKEGYGFIVPERYRWLTNRLEVEFRKFHGNRSSQTAASDLTQLSGVEFENYLVGLLKRNGFEDIRGTPSTGDQGADLIAKRANKTIVIQAKRYQGSVGNKAVQEVVAAIKFYHADEGWVITIHPRINRGT